jgi:monofunctional biosynthetic peptidoglycan transglycosylase
LSKKSAHVVQFCAVGKRRGETGGKTRNSSAAEGKGTRSGKILKWALLAAGTLILIHLIPLGYYGIKLAGLRNENPSMTAIMRERRATAPLDEKGFIPLKEIPEFTKRLVVRAEDSRFYRHFGIDLQSIAFAMKINAKKGEIVYGGSTITQQLARTLFLSINRSYLRKYLEALIALEAELILGKERILELYLNCVEWGPGVYGLKRASRYHYGVEVRGLTENQVVRLVTVLASPVRVNPKECEKDKLLGPRYRSLLAAAAALRGRRQQIDSVFEKSD